MVITVIIENTTTEANTYIVGQAVRLFIPHVYGMYQANNLVGTIMSINSNQFTLNLNSTQFDAFVIPSSIKDEQPATISPNGSRNYQYRNGSSLAVPYQSLNNIGN